MSNDPLDDFMAELLHPDTVFQIGGTDKTMPLGQFLALAAMAMDDLDDESSAPPKRGTGDYRALVRFVAEKDDVDAVGDLLLGMHDVYGWRGVADVMAEWTLQIERGGPMYSDSYRDPLSGAVDMSRLVAVYPTEEQKLLTAADRKDQYVKTLGLPPHEAFRKAVKDTEDGLAFLQEWYPYFRAALMAAHTTKDRRAIVAELFKAPGRTEAKHLVRAALIFATAAYYVRHHDEMIVAMKAAAGDAPVSHDESITPGWSGGGYINRSFLRTED